VAAGKARARAGLNRRPRANMHSFEADLGAAPLSSDDAIKGNPAGTGTGAPQSDRRRW